MTRTAMDHAAGMLGIRTDYVRKLTCPERRQIRNLKYRAWVVEQQGHTAGALNRLRYDPEGIYAALSLYHSVSGRILIAHLSPDQRARLTGRIGLPEEQWDGIASLPELEKACSKICRDRLSVMRNPELGIIAFAVPVFRPDGRVFSLGLTMADLMSIQQKELVPKLPQGYRLVFTGQADCCSPCS